MVLAALLLMVGPVPAACSHDPAVRAVVLPQADTQRGLMAATVSLTGDAADYDTLVARAADANFVLLGEDTHGTAEYYRERARITLRLVHELGFRGVILEADWPEAARINAYVRGEGEDGSAREALSGFVGFPQWTWRNAEFAEFIEDLRRRNLEAAPTDRVGVYGMDVYDLFGSLEAVVKGLSDLQSPDLAFVRQQYRCFSPYRSSSEAYGLATRNPANTCEDEATAVAELLQRRPVPEDHAEREARFVLVGHAAHVAAAEEYYRAAHSGSYAWNVRDRSMAETVQAVSRHLRSADDAPGRVAVWAHNTHVGDARATDMPLRGEINLGQILKERLGAEVLSLGFLTHRGTVRAAPEWGRRSRVFEVRPALPESVAALFQSLAPARALIWFDELQPAEMAALDRIERAIGVVYRPREERASHYFQAAVASQFDGAIFWEETTAVTPLDR